MVSKTEYVSLETLKDTDIGKMNQYADVFKWDPANSKEKIALVNEYCRKIVFGNDEFGSGFPYTTAHMMRDLALRTNLTETEKFAIVIAVSQSTSDILISKNIMNTLTRRG